MAGITVVGTGNMIRWLTGRLKISPAKFLPKLFRPDGIDSCAPGGQTNRSKLLIGGRVEECCHLPRELNYQRCLLYADVRGGVD